MHLIFNCVFSLPKTMQDTTSNLQSWQLCLAVTLGLLSFTKQVPMARLSLFIPTSTLSRTYFSSTLIPSHYLNVPTRLSVAHMRTTQHVLDDDNANLSAAQKALLLDHQRLGHVHMSLVQKLYTCSSFTCSPFSFQDYSYFYFLGGIPRNSLLKRQHLSSVNAS